MKTKWNEIKSDMYTKTDINRYFSVEIIII